MKRLRQVLEEAELAEAGGRKIPARPWRAVARANEIEKLLVGFFNFISEMDLNGNGVGRTPGLLFRKTGAKRR